MICNFVKNIVAKTDTNVNCLRRNINIFPRLQYCQAQPSGPVTESLITKRLRDKFPRAKSISVEDTSGGCGAMFNVSIETADFKGLSVMKQHKLVYEVLSEQIKEIHGLHLETKVPKE